MITTVTSIDIERPAADVFDFVADMANNPRWQRGQVRCTWTSEPPIGIGSTYDQEARFLGKTIESSFEVVEFEPGRRIRIVTTSGTMPLDVVRSVRADGPDRCVVTAEVSGEPQGVIRLAGSLVGRLVRRSVAADYRRLKELLEGA